jgi:hypothetical protein
MPIILNYAKNIPYNISGSGTRNYVTKWSTIKALTSDCGPGYLSDRSGGCVEDSAMV